MSHRRNGCEVPLSCAPEPRVRLCTNCASVYKPSAFATCRGAPGRSPTSFQNNSTVLRSRSAAEIKPLTCFCNGQPVPWHASYAHSSSRRDDA